MKLRDKPTASQKILRFHPARDFALEPSWLLSFVIWSRPASFASAHADDQQIQAESRLSIKRIGYDLMNQATANVAARLSAPCRKGYRVGLFVGGHVFAMMPVTESLLPPLPSS